MRVLITGGAGFIGSHTADALLAAGHEVRVLDSLEPPVHQTKSPLFLSPNAEFQCGSVTDAAAFRRALEGVDAVYHLAAYQDYMTDFSHFFHTNSVGAALLYELIVNDKFPIRKVIVASSQAIYGEGKYRCAEHGLQYPEQRPEEQLERGDWEVRCPSCGAQMEMLATDEARVAPHNSYGLSKRDQEDIALKLGRRYGIPSVALRYSIVQGPRQSFHNTYSGALRAFSVRLLSGASPVIYEDGQQVRDYVSIHDVVRANLLVLNDERADYQAFNVGGDRRVTVSELADLVIAEAGADQAPIISGMYRMGDTRRIYSDVSKLRALDWSPQVPQKDIVREYLLWLSQQAELSDTFEGALKHMESTGVLRKVIGAR